MFCRAIDGDTPGTVYDGENPGLIDVDYTDEATAITAHFSGFVTARCGGMPRFEWAVGEGWGDGERESIMAFTERGIVQTEEFGSGYAQVCTYIIIYHSLPAALSCSVFSI